MSAEQVDWLRLHLTPGLGRAGLLRLQRAFGDAESILDAGPGAWKAAGVRAALTAAGLVVAARAPDAGVEAVDARGYRRTARIAHGGREHRGWIEVAPLEAKRALRVRVSASLAKALPPVLARVKALMDLSCHPHAVAAASSLVWQEVALTGGTSRDFEAQITALQDRQDALDAQAKSSQMALDYLTRLMSVGVAPDDSRDRPARMMDPRTLTGLAEAMHAAAAKSLAQMQALAVQKREIGRRMDALQRDLERLRSAGTDTRTLTVNFAAQRAGTLLISYEVSNAGWRPAYRASLNSETSIVELERDAIISQQTGEDWHDVRLTLSTSQPRQATRGQEPQQWLLSYVAQIYEEAFRGAPVAMEAAPMSYAVIANQGMIADKALSKPAAAPYAPPTVETQGVFANTYEVPGGAGRLRHGGSRHAARRLAAGRNSAFPQRQLCRTRNLGSAGHGQAGIGLRPRRQYPRVGATAEGRFQFFRHSQQAPPPGDRHAVQLCEPAPAAGHAPGAGSLARIHLRRSGGKDRFCSPALA